jgi:hypothetical protein
MGTKEEDFVSRSDATSHQRQEEGIRPRGDPYGVSASTILGDGLLQGFDLGSHDKLLGLEDLVEGQSDFVLKGRKLRNEIKEGDLPKTVSKYGNNIEEIFVCYEELKEKYGSRIKDIPMGAVGIYTYVQKFRTGLQQIMAGSRNR